MFLRLAALVLGVPLLAHGAEGLYYAARNTGLVTVSCERFMQAPPPARWLRVTGCDIDYTHPAFSASRGRVSELFFTMRLRTEPASAPASLVVATRNAEALAIADEGLGHGTPVDEETFTVAMLRVVNLLRAAREVDGYARSGILERAFTRRALADFSAALAADAVVLDLHAQPTLVRPAIEAAAGLLLVAAGTLRRRPRAEPAVSPTPLERCLPSAMLLNLDVAEPSQIEYAPPLGPREDVVTRISGVLGPLTPEAEGRYRVGAGEWSLTLDLGRDDPVWTATADARGSDAAIDALDRLARENRWRVYVPRWGSFRFGNHSATTKPTE